MTRDSASSTSATLLDRLRSDDKSAWTEFVDRYGPKIYAWCRSRRLQEEDARDVTQEVLVKLLNRMRTFEYDRTRSFRSWLWLVTQHACIDFTRGRARSAVASGDEGVQRLLENVADRDDLVKHLNEVFDHEVLEQAEARVRLRVQPHYWEAYRLLEVERLSGDEAAARLGISRSLAFVARGRVIAKLRDVVLRLVGTGAREEGSP
jgi:RNA polymerase sigma-70 factor (ECF subfamily)